MSTQGFYYYGQVNNTNGGIQWNEYNDRGTLFINTVNGITSATNGINLQITNINFSSGINGSTTNVYLEVDINNTPYNFEIDLTPNDNTNTQYSYNSKQTSGGSVTPTLTSGQLQLVGNNQTQWLASYVNSSGNTIPSRISYSSTSNAFNINGYDTNNVLAFIALATYNTNTNSSLKSVVESFYALPLVSLIYPVSSS